MEKVISEQRRKDLEAATQLYLEGYCSKAFEISGKFIEYASFYHLTNESVETFLKIVTITSETKALSILASGDQVFNLVQRGLKDIDTFDINRLTEYYALGFKKRAIECLSFEDYNKLFEYYKNDYEKTHNCQHLDIEKYVISNMDEEYKWFWQEFLYRSKEVAPHELNSIFMLAEKNEFKAVQEVKTNIYMENHENYRKLQQNLINAKVTFRQMDIVNMTPDNGRYDIIFLSNIFDYYEDMFGICSFSEAFKVVKNIYDYNLKENGELIFTKLFSRFIDCLMIEECVKTKSFYLNNYCEGYGWKKPRSRKK